MIDKVPCVNLDKIDFKNVFLHYTNSNNIDSIFKYGLEPRIGENSKGLEKSKKFFLLLEIRMHLLLWMCG